MKAIRSTLYALRPSGVRRTARSGWTLVELLIVIAIIGLLIGYMVPKMASRMLTQARVSATRSQEDELKKALVGDPNLVVNGEFVSLGYRGDVGAWPPAAPGDTLGLTWLWRQPVGVPAYNPYTKHGWNGPYIHADSSLKFLDDSWGNSYRFVRDGLGQPIGIQSAGPDGYFGPPPGSSTVDDITVMF
jgi:general secretion pathway protein G